MLVTSADAASLDGLLSWWEGVEYVAETFVILGCLGEFIAEFTNIRTPDRRRQLGKASLLVLIAALAVELGALVRTNSLAGQEIALLNGETARANERTAKIQALLLPRKLTDEQRKRLIEKLSPYAGVAIDVFALDQEDVATRREALDFAEDLVKALRPVAVASGHSGMGCRPWPVVGVIVEAVQDSSRDRYAAGELLSALTPFVVPYIPSIQIPPCAAFLEMPSNPPKSRAGWAKIIIIVGKRPTPILKLEPPPEQTLPNRPVTPPQA